MYKTIYRSSKKLYRLFFQLVIFDDHDRREFLEVLHIQLDANLPLTQVFQNIARTGSTPQMKKLAEQSIRDMTAYNDCTYHWDAYYSTEDTLHLRNAFRQDNIQKGIELVIHSQSDAVSFVAAVIKSNNQYLLFVAGMLVMLLVLNEQRSMLESFNSDMLLFKYFEWFSKWTWPMLIISSIAFFIYSFYRKTLRGGLRSFFYKFGIYVAYDRLVAYQFCIIARDSLKSGLDMTEIIRLCEEIFTEQRQRYGLFLVRQRLTDGFAVATALKGALFEPLFSDYLTSLAPSEGRQQLSLAFDKVAQLLNTRVEQQFRQLRYYLMSVLLLLGFVLFYPMLQLMTGAAMPS